MDFIYWLSPDEACAGLDRETYSEKPIGRQLRSLVPVWRRRRSSVTGLMGPILWRSRAGQEKTRKRESGRRQEGRGDRHINYPGNVGMPVLIKRTIKKVIRICIHKWRLLAWKSE